MSAWTNFRQALPSLIAQHGTSALVQGGIGAGVSMAGVGAMNLLQAATKSRDFRKMMEFNPDLAEHHAADPKTFNQMYTSLRVLNPTYAQDPIISGSFMRQMVESPSHAGSFLTNALAARAQGASPIQEGLMQGLKKGPLGRSPFEDKPPAPPSGSQNPLPVEKIAFFPGESEEHGPLVIPLFTEGFEKVAADSRLLPEVVRYIEALRPRPDAQYVLVNAMGAGEFWGSNINGDYFPEAGLIHVPEGWTGNPLLDRLKAKDWPYGYPTFYNAQVFAHHKNKNAEQGFGGVELAVWNPHMKRVELVTRLDRERCEKFGGQAVWDKLRAGEYPSVSMGCAPKGTRITAADGRQIVIEDVQEGDLVLSHKGRARRVEATMRRPYKGTLYTFKTFGFRRELPLTDEHPLWLVKGEQLSCRPTPKTLNRGRRAKYCTPFAKEKTRGCSGCSTTPSYTFSWVRADEAEVGDYLSFPVPEEVQSTVQSVEEAQFLGYYLAEGFVGDYNAHKKAQITFCLSLHEKAAALEIEDLARKLGAEVIWHEEQPARTGRYVHVVSRDLAQRCIKFCGEKAKTKQLSSDVLFMDPALQLHFLGKYLDGDGGTYKGAAYFSTASAQLANQLFIVLARCRVISSINEIHHRPSKRSLVQKATTEFQVWVGTDFASVLAPYTRKEVRTSSVIRGQRFFYQHEGVTYLMAPIVRIEEQDFEGEVFNFSVEEDDSYVAELLATHNCKVPFDLCSICTDWPLYREAEATHDPKKYPSAGAAILAFHKARLARTGKGIRGLSPTPATYCEHFRTQRNKILPDGRKVYVSNPYPRFFDISYVFVGADRTAKAMMKIASGHVSSEQYVEQGSPQETLEGAKTASVDATLKTAFLGKLAGEKKSEISKRVLPVPDAKAIPVLSRNEKDFPKEILDRLALAPMSDVLSTTGGMGMVLRPREFQRIVLIRMGSRPLADHLEEKRIVFPKSSETSKTKMGPEFFSAILARLLFPFLESRSALGPLLEKRAWLQSEDVLEGMHTPTSLSSELLHKMGSVYNGYRDGLMELIANAQPLIKSAALSSEREFQKLSSADIHEVFTPLTVHYLNHAFQGEFGETGARVVGSKSASADAESGVHSGNA